MQAISAVEKGTLYQLKVLLNNASALDPAKNLRDCEDFLLIVLHSHTVAAGKALLSEDKQYKNVTELAIALVNTFCNFDLDVKDASNDKAEFRTLMVCI